MRTSILVYVSGHGFGHATRVMEVLKALSSCIHCHIRTLAPEWLFRMSLPASLSWDIHPLRTDVGVVQEDSLHVSPSATLQAYREFSRNVSLLVGQEAEFARRSGTALIFADIPPLAFEVAERSGMPGIAFSNFSWDWIYEAYIQDRLQDKDILRQIRSSYSKAALCLRLPFHGDLSVFPKIVDIPLVARKSRKHRAETLKTLDMDGGRPWILLSFGGIGFSGLALAELSHLREYGFIATDYEFPSGNGVKVIPNSFLREKGLRYEDLVAACDVVITKPGYGIVSECVANRTRMLYTSRGLFPEYDVLVKGLQGVIPSLHIPLQAFLRGDFGDYLEKLMAEPISAKDMPADGAAFAARILEDSLREQGFSLETGNRT
ncbi:MAG: hypothetical protein HYU64_07365 [Armatimonadetes bacterium]|nr:hypothetical protein [Armatimonadota bacterium]